MKLVGRPFFMGYSKVENFPSAGFVERSERAK